MQDGGTDVTGRSVCRVLAVADEHRNEEIVSQFLVQHSYFITEEGFRLNFMATDRALS